MENSNSNSNSKSKKLEKNNSKNRMMMLERGVVGLSIVAAMNITKTTSTHVVADIVSSANKAASNFRGTTTIYGLFFASTLNNIGGTHHQFLSPTSYFLSSCNLCNKHLHGVDIFIYRGERAFCSAECRERHMRNSDDNYQDKCRRSSGLMKPLHSSIPPCSRPPFSPAGIAAA